MNLDRILKTLQEHACLCDACLSKISEVKPVQAVNQTCRKQSDLILRNEPEDDVRCCGCHDNRKITNSLATISHGVGQSNESILVDGLWSGELAQNKLAEEEESAEQDAFSRSIYLKRCFNQTIAETLQIPEADYMERLDIDGLIALKAIMSNVHATITMRLTVALADWLESKIGFDEHQCQNIKSAVDSSKPFEAGFDIDVTNPNIIGEIKGNIPNGDKSLFKSAQLKGLTNDVRQMFGLEPVDKSVSVRSKIHRKDRIEALKFLGLYDSPSVRSAAHSWMKSFQRAHPELKLATGNDLTEFNSDTVYVVFLKLAAIAEPTEVTIV